MSERNSFRRKNTACKTGAGRVLSFILSLAMSCMLILTTPGMAVCVTVAAEALESGVEEVPGSNTDSTAESEDTPAGDVAVEIWEPGQSRPESAEESAGDDTDSTDSEESDTDSTDAVGDNTGNMGISGNAGTVADPGVSGNAGTVADPGAGGNAGTVNVAPAVTAAPEPSPANVVWQNDLPEELFANVRITYNTVGDSTTDAAANAGNTSGNASGNGTGSVSGNGADGSSGSASGMPFAENADSGKTRDGGTSHASGDMPAGNNPVDFVLILDGSDSMLHSDPDALYISAARMFIDMLPSENARLAVVGFGPDYGEEAYRGIQFEPEESYRNRQVKVYYDLQSIADQDSKQTAKAAVSRSKQETDDFPGLTYTPIGYAMQTANAILEEGNSAPENAAIILLSDGRVSGQSDGYNDALDYRSIDEASEFAASKGWPVYCLELNFDGANDSTHWRGKIGHHQMRDNIPERTDTEPIALNDPDEAERAFTEIFARFFEATETMTMESDTIEGGKASMDFTVDEMVAETNITLTGPIAEVESVELIEPDGTSEMYNVSDGNIDNLDRKVVFEDRYISLKLIMPPDGGWTVSVYGTDGVRIGLYAVSIRELTLLLTDNLPPADEDEIAEGQTAAGSQTAGEGQTAAGSQTAVGGQALAEGQTAAGTQAAGNAENASGTENSTENASTNGAAGESIPIWAQTVGGTTLSTGTQADAGAAGTGTQADAVAAGTAAQVDAGVSGAGTQANGTGAAASEETSTPLWQKYLAPVDAEAAELPESVAAAYGTSAPTDNASAGATDTPKAPLWQQYTSSGYSQAETVVDTAAGTAGGTTAGGTSAAGTAGGTTAGGTTAVGTAGGTTAGGTTAAADGNAAAAGTTAVPLWQQYASSGSALAETAADTAAAGTTGADAGNSGNDGSGSQTGAITAGDGITSPAGTADAGTGTFADAGAGTAESSTAVNGTAGNGTAENSTDAADAAAQAQDGGTANGETAGRRLTPGTTVEFEASFAYRGKPYTTDAVYQRIPAKLKIMHDGLEAAVIPMEASGSIYTASYTFTEAGSYSVHASAEHEAFRLGERNSDALLYAVVVPEEPVAEEPPAEEPEEEIVEEPVEEAEEEKPQHSIMFTSLTGAAPDADSAKMSEQLYLKRIGPPNFLMNMAGIEPKDSVTINYADYFADPANPNLEGVTFTCTDMLGSTAGIAITEQDDRHATITATDKGSGVFLVTATDTNGETPVQKTIQFEISSSKAWSEILHQYWIYAIVILAAAAGLIVAIVFFVRSRL